MNDNKAIWGALAITFALTILPGFVYAATTAISDELCPLGFPIAITPSQDLGICDGRSRVEHAFETFPGTVVGVPFALVSFIGGVAIAAPMKTRGGDAGMGKFLFPFFAGAWGYETGQKVGAFPFVALKRALWDCPAYIVKGPTERTGTARNGVLVWDKRTIGLSKGQLFHGAQGMENRKPQNTCQ